MADDPLRCPACGTPADAEDDACRACGAELPLPRGIPAIAVTEPWHRNPMVRLAFVTIAVIAIAVVVILMNPG